jgi:hypothetical protein
MHQLLLKKVELKSRLAIKTDELNEMKQKVTIMEQELKAVKLKNSYTQSTIFLCYIFKKNEYQNSYRSLVDAHNKQNREIQLLQMRLQEALSLEETCKRQEIVIEKMESLIRKIVGERSIVGKIQ